MNITHLTSKHANAAAALFADNFTRFRQSIPILPDTMASPALTAEHLEHLLAHSQAVAAFDCDHLVGYLGWWLVDNFRETARRAAYCPVWAHAVAPAPVPTDAARHTARVYRALYRAASEIWFAAGCQTHAVTLLAGDAPARNIWFWNGFGLAVVDAVRSLDPLGIAPPVGYTLRLAAADDASALEEIEAEHWRHYPQPPTLMTTSGANSADEFVELISNPANRVWTAWKGPELAAYLRFESASDGASEIVSAADTTACTGAYTRPAHRGKKLAAALLDSALADYRAQGYARCSVDFESFNPEAASFWVKYFEPVCFSVFRVPERTS